MVTCLCGGQAEPPGRPLGGLMRYPWAPRHSPECRAREALMAHLSERQKATYPSGFIDVKGSLGGWYRLGGTAYFAGDDLLPRFADVTVYSIDCRGGRIIGGWCAHPRTWLPRDDWWLVVLLLLHADEATWIKTANPGTIRARREADQRLYGRERMLGHPPDRWLHVREEIDRMVRRIAEHG